MATIAAAAVFRLGAAGRRWAPLGAAGRRWAPLGAAHGIGSVSPVPHESDPSPPELASLRQLMPLAATLGIEVDAASSQEVRGHLAWAPQLCTAGGVLHGGALMALADSLGGLCAYLNLPAGTRTATISSATAFTRAIRSGVVTAVARPLHTGRTVIVVQTDLTDDAGRLAAQVTQTQSVLPS